MEISAVIPVHDRPRELVSAVASVVAQSRACAEIIVVDDGSSRPVAREELGKDPRIRVIRHDRNRGAAAARNTGIEAATGQYVAFLDSDDRWAAGKIEAQSLLLDADGSDWRCAAVTGWRQERAGQSELFSPVPAASLSDFTRGCWFCPGSTLLVARRAFQEVGPFDEHLPRLEDYEWFLRFGAKGGRIVVSEGPLANIRWHRTVAPDTLDHAARLIGQSYLRPGGPSRLTSRTDRRRVAAFLSYVKAATLWYAGRRPEAVLALLHSLLSRPRFDLRQKDVLRKSIEAPRRHVEVKS